MQLFAGVAWSEHGFHVEFVDASGSSTGPARTFATSELSALVRLVTGSVVTVDSTNGVLDGTLLAAGVDVRRADPGQLPPRHLFGSVPALELARLSLIRTATRLSLAEGSLTGRLGELTAATATAGPTVDHGDRDRLEVALTFDDGPHPVHTAEVLDALDRYGAPATFFCVGISVSSQPELLARAAASGHAIANHTWSHPFLPDLRVNELQDQVARTRDALTNAVGTTPAFVRPPYGSLNREVMQAWEPLPEQVVLWDVEAEDWVMPGADVIADRVLNATRPGSIILLHDGGGDRSQTARSLPAIIEGCLARGLRFVTVPDMLT